ncbi:hypothetical protein O0L34_g4031 [Tuta absoluta]|nr:hypothetical protein O0L34_g4031 [Tuta absoluta]
MEHQDDDWSSLAEGNQRVKRREKTGLAHHRRYETDTSPTARTSYDGTNEELDINHENYTVLGKTPKRGREEKGKTKRLRFWMNNGYTYEEASEKCTRQLISSEYHETIARQQQADKNTEQSYSSSADDGVESDDLASFFKERYIKYPSQKKRFAFWMDYGYTREEAANRCFRALKEFPEYHEMKGFPGENAMKLNESNKSGKRTYDRAPYNKDQSEDIASPSPNSTHKKPSSSKIDPNYLRKLEKKRKLFWLNHGYSLEEAEARCHRELKEFPEFKQLKAAGETATFSAANKLKFYDFEDRKTKKPISTHNEITIGIIDDNNVITNDKIKLIEKEIIRCMDFTSASPNFTSYTIKKGCLILACEDGDTRDWLVDNIANFKPWEGASLRVIEEDDLPSPIWAIIKTRDKVQPQTLLNRLTVQNEEVGCDRWKFHHVKQGDKLQACFFRIDSKSEDILRQNMRKLFLGLGIIRVHINKNPGFKKVRD